jgi:glycosyl transferase family (putative galactosyltransferase)
MGSEIKVTLLTGCDEAFDPVLAPTLPNKIAYCERHNVRFVNHRYAVSPWGDRERLMLKELDAQYFSHLSAKDGAIFRKCDWLWFLDADTVIMNHTKDIRDVIDEDYDCIIGRDRLGLNNGSLLLKNSPATIDFLNAVLSRTGIDPNDQVAMVNVMNECPTYHVKRVGQREIFNSFLETEHGRDADPRYHWQPGDPGIHFPAQSIHRRCELIREYLPRVIQ